MGSASSVDEKDSSEEVSVVVDESVAGSVFSSEVAAGVVVVSVCSKSITVEENVFCLDRYARLREVSIKTTAAAMVTLLKKLVGPRLPKTV